MKIAYFSTIVFFFLTNSGTALAQGPQFTWAKSMGGPGAESAVSIAQDAKGNIYTTGTFAGTADFNPGAGIFNLTVPIFAPFISKLDSKGDFVWAKQLGIGNGYSLCVDIEGNVYTTGRFTGVGDFDPGPAVFNLTSAGNTDIFISKLDSLGNFVWAKSLGGIAEDVAYDIAVKGDTLILTGSFRNNADFDPGPNSFNILADFIDVFVAAMNTDGEFIWARRMGGGKSEDGLTGSAGNSVSIDTAGSILVTGFFSGTGDFNPGTNVLEFTSNGEEDIFVVKLDSNGNFIWGFPLGGSGQDIGRGIATDLTGHVYVAGSFESSVDFDHEPLTEILYEARGSDIFVASYHLNGFIKWAKQIGSPLDDQANDIYVDQISGVHTTGSFWQTADFDPGPGEFLLSTILNDNRDIFISSLNLGGGFISAVRMGGLQNDQGNAIMVDFQNNLVTAGAFTGFVDFDPGAPTFNITGAGGTDIFVQKLCQAPIMNITGPQGFCPGSVISLTSDLADNYLWSTGDTTQSINVSMPGLYVLTVTNGNGCSGVIEMNVIAYPAPDKPSINSNNGTTICKGDSLELSTDIYSQYTWNTGEETQQIVVNEQGNYVVTVTNEFGCKSVSDEFFIEVFPVPELIFSPSDFSFCEGDSLLLEANIEADFYLWSTGETSRTILIKEAGEYEVEVTFNTGCTTKSNKVNISVDPLPEIELGEDIILESGESVSLDAGPGHVIYQWSTGEITQSITTDSMGIYYVTVVNEFGCVATDSVAVTIMTSSADGIVDFNLTVTPNPSDGVIYIQSQNISISGVKLFNSQGLNILIESDITEAKERRELSLESLAPGFYYLQVWGDKELRTIPLIKI